MGAKNRTKHIQKDKVIRKFVPRANMFVITTIVNNKQSQEWVSK